MQFTSPVWSQARGALAGCVFRSSSGRLIATARAQKPHFTPRNGSWQSCFIHAACLWTHKTTPAIRDGWSNWATTAGFKSGRDAFMHKKPYENYIYFHIYGFFNNYTDYPSIAGSLTVDMIRCVPSPISSHGLRIYLQLNNVAGVFIMHRYIGPFSPSRHTFRGSEAAAITYYHWLPPHYSGHYDFTKMIAGRRYFFTIWAYESFPGCRAIRPVYCDGIAG